MELLRFVYKNFCENKRLLIFIIMGNFLTFVLALVVPYLNGFYFNIVIYTPSKEKINLTLAVLSRRVVDTGHSICFKKKHYRTVNSVWLFNSGARGDNYDVDILF